MAHLNFKEFLPFEIEMVLERHSPLKCWAKATALFKVVWSDVVQNVSSSLVTLFLEISLWSLFLRVEFFWVAKISLVRFSFLIFLSIFALLVGASIETLVSATRPRFFRIVFALHCSFSEILFSLLISSQVTLLSISESALDLLPSKSAEFESSSFVDRPENRSKEKDSEF